jgi:exopolysaccharide production protein ExoQ
VTATAFVRSHNPAERAYADWLPFALAVFMLFMYAQAWVAPLIGDKAADAQAGGIIRALYYPSYVAGLALLFGAAKRSALGLLKAPLLVVLVGLAVASVLWSVDPSTTMRRGIAIVVTTLAGVVLAARFSWVRLAQAIAVTFAILVVLSYITGALIPSLGRMQELFPGAWRGPWAEKNALGGNMAMGFVIFAATAMLDQRRRWLWAGFAVAALGLVLLSTSKTSLVALMQGAAVFGFVWLARRGPVMGVIMVWLAAVVVAGAAAVMIFAPHLVFDALGKDATLTGRTKLWESALRQARSRPWFGFGYGAIWDNDDPWGPLVKITRDGGFKAKHAHSSWVEMKLNLGTVGVVTWGLYFLETWSRSAVAVFTTRGAYLAMPLLAVYSLISLTESITLIWNDLRWVLFVALAVKLALGDQESAQEPAARAPRRAISAWP